MRIAETQTKDIRIGQNAEVDTRNGIVKGRVSRIDPASNGGTVGVDVMLDGALPAGARPDLSVDGTIQLEKLDNVIYVGRPAFGQENSTVTPVQGGAERRGASRTKVKLGRGSVNTIEVMEGLQPGRPGHSLRHVAVRAVRSRRLNQLGRRPKRSQKEP